ncbi:MAG: multidrug efflux RND transporter permease subunit [Victivallales bacterium]|nr:multidrug efflux RND transporter permease subunit [Victivallales bacterium]MCF7888987.1 multidrug efflux RND transporter permease subunit [Victivallales bacterium]
MISQFFIKRPKFAFVISIVFLLAGGIAIYCLPTAQYPEIVPPKVSISASYPGANASTVEKTVVSPIEQQVNGVEDMIYMSSLSANDGSSSITVTFDIGTDPDMNTVNTNNKVAVALPKLPSEVSQQGVTVKQKGSQILMILNIISPSGKYDGVFLSNFASLNILDVISRVPGVSEASVLGAQDYSMRIWLNPDKMASLSLTTSDVINAIKEQNVQVAAGQIGGAPSGPDQQFQYTIQAKGRLSNVKEFENIIIRAYGDGSEVLVKDVAKVEMGATSYSAYGLLNGKPAANLAVYQLSDANALEVSESIRTELKKLSHLFNKDVDCKILYDTTDFVKASIGEVLETLYIAVALVILVTVFFLQDWRSSLIPMIAIPVSLIGTFAFLLAMGYTINTISLFGLILAIGIVVDDAIVVVENTKRIIKEEGLDPVEATKKSMNQITGPVIATTLVLMAVFVPVAFLPGITGELYRQFAVTISISVGISSINALTLSPALCSLLLKPEKKNKRKLFLFRWFDKFLDFTTAKYNKAVSMSLRKLSVVAMFFILLIGSIYMLYEHLPTGFLPSEDQGAFMVNIQLPNGASLNRTREKVDRTTSILSGTKGVADVISFCGYSLLSASSSSNMGFAIAVLDNWSKRPEKKLHASSIIKQVNKKFRRIPGAEVFAYNLPPIPGLGTGGGFEFVLQDTRGNNPQRLAEVLKRVIEKANQSPVISTAFSTFEADVPQIFLNVDREKAKKLSITLTEIFNTLQTYLGSMYVNDFNKFGKVYNVYLQAQEEFRGKVEDIYDLYVRNGAGNMVPMSTLVSAKTILGPEVINHYNMFESATINGKPEKGYSSGDAIKEMERIADELLPGGMKYSWTGTAYQEILAGNMTVIIFTLAIIFIYLFLVAQYESWMVSLAVMMSVPVAIIGALAALWVSGIPNNIYAQIGFVLLFGMATKTAILIVEFAKVEREKGVPISEAAKKAAHTRFRAVLMTAFSAILGFMPLVIATGAGANSRHSLGWSVLGGMISATILGTLFVPSFYAIIQKTTEKFCGKNKNKE